jgi:dipeptidyl aminopeptidase/acylaminoacyl peptidase
MKYIFLIAILFHFTITNFGQTSEQLQISNQTWSNKSKPPLNIDAINNWIRFESNPLISNDGKYIAFSTTTFISSNTLYVLSTRNMKKLVFPNADYKSGFFSTDCKQFVFLKRDTLCFLTLGINTIKKVPNVNSFQQITGRNNHWLSYRLKDGSNKLILCDLLSGKEYYFTSVNEYFFDKNGKALVIISKGKIENTTRSILKWVTLPDIKISNIWEGESNSFRKDSIYGYDIDAESSQLAFTVGQESTVDINENNSPSKISSPACLLWYYKSGMSHAIIKATNMSKGIENNLEIQKSIPQFSKDGKYIYFQLKNREIKTQKSDAAMVDVWNYRDKYLQSTQVSNITTPVYIAVIGTMSEKVVRLIFDNEFIRTYDQKNGQIIVTCNSKGDRYWLNTLDTNWLVSLENGNRVLLPSGYKDFFFSPGGKYLVYFDLLNSNYYKYDVRNGESINLSSTIQSNILSFKSEYHEGEPCNQPIKPVGIAGWSENDSLLFVYDNYDVWQLNPGNNTPAINITNFYGRNNHIKFRFLYGTVNMSDPVIFKANETVLLIAYNTKTKENGFYIKSINIKGAPVLLSLGQYIYFVGAPNFLPMNPQNFNYGVGMIPIKAKNTKVWIVRRQSTVDAPNYFLTSDFKKFQAATDFQPQLAYNWLTADLVTWKQLDSSYSQGILYKPENFNNDKKYPVIINFYEQRSHRLYQFPTPKFTDGNIDVPWFVSNGYLVFTPDIYFKNNNSSQSIFNSIISAARWLSTLSYVDSQKIAISGHSTAGGLTNYLITHTDIFAAALEGAGISDAISSSLQLSHTFYGASRLETTESAKGDMSIWDNPDLYLQSSPILKANKIKTPLLIMHNKLDAGVPWLQAVELFLALWRLEKPVWLLQYDFGDHILLNNKEAQDFTIRATQFFNHYLKGAPMPNWMSKGIPLKLKGIETGYDLDTND